MTRHFFKFLYALSSIIDIMPRRNIQARLDAIRRNRRTGDISRYFAATSGYMEKAAHKVLGNG